MANFRYKIFNGRGTLVAEATTKAEADSEAYKLSGGYVVDSERRGALQNPRRRNPEDGNSSEFQRGFYDGMRALASAANYFRKRNPEIEPDPAENVKYQAGFVAAISMLSPHLIAQSDVAWGIVNEISGTNFAPSMPSEARQPRSVRTPPQQPTGDHPQPTGDSPEIGGKRLPKMEAAIMRHIPNQGGIPKQKLLAAVSKEFPNVSELKLQTAFFKAFEDLLQAGHVASKRAVGVVRGSKPYKGPTESPQGQKTDKPAKPAQPKEHKEPETAKATGPAFDHKTWGEFEALALNRGVAPEDLASVKEEALEIVSEGKPAVGILAMFMNQWMASSVEKKMSEEEIEAGLREIAPENPQDSKLVYNLTLVSNPRRNRSTYGAGWGY